MLPHDEKKRIARESGLFYIEGDIDWKASDFLVEEIQFFIAKGLASGKYPDLTFTIDSGGGLVEAGLSIYDTIVAYPGSTKTVVFPRAGSVATSILQAGDKRVITPNGKVLFHYMSTRMNFNILSDPDKLNGELEKLKELHESLIKTRKRLTIGREELLALYEEEAWIYLDEILSQQPVFFYRSST